jgi:hypothetical protein
MKYFITFIILTTYLSSSALADSDMGLKIILAAMPDTGTAVIRKQSVSMGVNYGTDESFFGRTSPYAYPFVSGDVIYNSKNGLFVYGSLWKVLGSTPTIDEADLGGGFSYKFSKQFRGELSYTHFFFNALSPIIKSSATNDINFKNSYDWKLFKTSATFDYLIGESSDFFITLNTSRYFESNWSVFDDKDYVTFTPSFSLILGTQNFVQNYSKDHDFFKDKNPNNHTPPPADPNPYNYKLDAGRNSQFNPLNYSLKIPIAYNRPHYTFEASYKYGIPVNVQGALLNSPESFFNLTFYYVFY